MEFIGLQRQIWNNNLKSILLLIAFPLLILFGVYAFIYIVFNEDIEGSDVLYTKIAPVVFICVGIWFLIAYNVQESIIKSSSGAIGLDRNENPRVWNLTENLCISVGMKTPKLYIIDSPELNAFASGIDENSYAVTLTSGIISELNDRELEGVIAHELTHIRNKDVRLLIVSIVFVGIIGFTTDIILRSLLRGGRGKKQGSSGIKLLLLALVISIIVYFFTVIFKFALSRKREYLADAGAVEMTKDAHALASALEKISRKSDLEVESQDLKQLFIENSPQNSISFLSLFGGLFASHPPIKKRIKILREGI